jgi:hypothetical protein
MPEIIRDCLDDEFQEYNANAHVHEPGACLNVRVIPKTATVIYTLEGRQLSVNLPGPHRVLVFSAAGKPVFRANGKGIQRYSLAGLEDEGVYYVRIETERHEETVTFLNY